MSKQRFLVLHDYGMGGLWWRISARSAREVAERFAELEVVDTPAVVEEVGGWELEEVDIDSPVMPAVLDGLRRQRDAQRGSPRFGALASRKILYVRQRDRGVDYLMEIGPDGRRTRQVELYSDGSAIKTDPEDWAFNPPVVDLFDPQLPDHEIASHEFENAWANAQRDKDRHW